MIGCEQALEVVGVIVSIIFHWKLLYKLIVKKWYINTSIRDTIDGKHISKGKQCSDSSVHKVEKLLQKYLPLSIKPLGLITNIFSISTQLSLAFLHFGWFLLLLFRFVMANIYTHERRNSFNHKPTEVAYKSEPLLIFFFLHEKSAASLLLELKAVEQNTMSGNTEGWWALEICCMWTDFKLCTAAWSTSTQHKRGVYK